MATLNLSLYTNITNIDCSDNPNLQELDISNLQNIQSLVYDKVNLHNLLAYNTGFSTIEFDDTEFISTGEKNYVFNNSKLETIGIKDTLTSTVTLYGLGQSNDYCDLIAWIQSKTTEANLNKYTFSNNFIYTNKDNTEYENLLNIYYLWPQYNKSDNKNIIIGSETDDIYTNTTYGGLYKLSQPLLNFIPAKFNNPINTFSEEITFGTSSDNLYKLFMYKMSPITLENLKTFLITNKSLLSPIFTLYTDTDPNEFSTIMTSADTPITIISASFEVPIPILDDNIFYIKFNI